jgi:hypothetical protein
MELKIKKILALGVMVIMVFGLFSCGGNNGIVVDDMPFYSLQAAYNYEFLSTEDLKTILSFHKNRNTNVLSETTTNDIKTSFIERYPQDEMTMDDVIISMYYGTYGQSVAVMIGYSNSNYTQVKWSETIGGVKFVYNNGQRILIWNNK